MTSNFKEYAKSVHGNLGLICGLFAVLTLALTLTCCSGAKGSLTDNAESRPLADKATDVAPEILKTPIALIVTREISGELLGKPLTAPSGIRRSASGHYFLIDRGNHRLLKLDSAFLPLVDFGGANSSGGELDAPERLALDGRGNVYLSDAEALEIFQFDEDLNLIINIRFLDTADALKFGAPSGLAVDNDGYLWVSDAERSRLAIFDNFGLFKEFYADYNSGGQPLERPAGMFALKEGGMIVCDEGEGRAVIYNSYGVQLDVIGEGILESPVDVSLDSSGRIWISDKSLGEILCFDRDGYLLLRTGDLGAAYDLKLHSPLGICISGDETLIIADSGANRILICRIILAS